MTRIARPFGPAAAPRGQPALLEIALRHSPSVEDGGPGIVYLDLGGLERLWGGEREIAARLHSAACERGAAVGGGAAGGPAAGGTGPLGDWAHLPSRGRAERLGGEGPRLQRLARGEDATQLRLWTPPL